MESARINQNSEALYHAASLLRDLNEQVVYVGGRIVGLLITDPIEDDVRPTFDIDVTIDLENTSIVGHYSLQKKLEELGFRPEGNINCRYLTDELVLDVLYTDGALQGINSNWYQAGFDNAINVQLKDKTIKIFNAVYFIATKLEAFTDRAHKNNDYWDCKDLEDIINVINGRPELLEECRHASKDVINFISSYFKRLIEDPKWLEAIKAIARHERARNIVLTTFEKIIALHDIATD
jgi:predicted nucleotidyltransferase